jgi:hypothetical protein
MEKVRSGDRTEIAFDRPAFRVHVPRSNRLTRADSTVHRYRTLA